MAPTVSGYYNGANNGVGGSTNRDVAGVSWGAGDLVIAMNQPGDGSISVAAGPTNANLTFTILPGLPVGGTGITMRHYVYKAEAASAQTGQTIAMTQSTSDQSVSAVLVIAAGTHNGVAATIYTDVTPATGTPPQGTLSGVSANSLLLAMVGCWSITSLSGGHTYRTDQAGTATQRTVLDNSTYGCGEIITYGDAGAAGSKTVGWLTPNGNDWSIVVIEVLAAAASQEFLPDADTVTTGWTATPLYSKLNDGSDATVVTATLA